MLLAVLAIIRPFDREIIYDALFYHDALSQSIVRLLLGVLAVIGGLEWLVRVVISRRRARGATTSS